MVASGGRLRIPPENLTFFAYTPRRGHWRMADQPAPQRIVVPFNGHVIGEGFNSDTVERVGVGLDVGSIGEDPQAPGQTAVFKFDMVTSQASLEKSLNIGAELEARYALFSGGGTFGFAESSAINTSSTYIVASCVVLNALRSGSHFTPNSAAQPLIDRGDTDGFKTAFGDRFTQALHTGGEFHALVRVTSSNTEHQRDISASLHGELNGLVTSGHFSASLDIAQKDASSHTEVDIQIYQTSGVGKQVKMPGADAASIRDHMNEFALAAHQSAAAYQAELLTYDTLALPFPSVMELQDRRLVLADCLVRRQGYLSAISDLTFAQEQDANLIFADLPSPQALVELQNAFRRILGQLMDHARGVAAGTIDPVPFVAQDEPPPPHFKRRSASSFAVWWAKRKQPDLLQDELFLITRIADQVRGIITVDVETASPEVMERAADTITELDLSFSEADTFPHLRSIAALPTMIDTTLRELTIERQQLADLTGIDTFTRLASVTLTASQVQDISLLASAAGIADLHVHSNNIPDLSPLRALTVLERLFIGGNRVTSLEPLRGLARLSIVSVARIERGTGALLENPVADARALDSLPLLANPTTSAAKLKLTLFDNMDTVTETGVATRIGNSHRFRYVPDGGSASEEILVMALWQLSDFSIVLSPVVVSAVHFRSRGVEGVAATHPDDPSGAMAGPDLAGFFLDDSFTGDGGAGEQFTQVAIGRVPAVFLELRPITP